MKDSHASEVDAIRKPDYPIHPLILHRWSPRAMTGEPLSDAELMPLFEAARWAPSSYNQQPWRFLYVKRDTKEWDVLFNLLVEANQEWCKKAAVLGLAFSPIMTARGKRSKTHTFETGAAWENLALEGTSRGLVVHGMEGFDYDKALKLLPKDHEVHAMFAIGKRAPKSSLPPALQEREVPSTRNPISTFVFKNKI